MYYKQVKKSSSAIYDDFLDLADNRERRCLMRLRLRSHRLYCSVCQGERNCKNNSIVSHGSKEVHFTKEVHLIAQLPFAYKIKEVENLSELPWSASPQSPRKKIQVSTIQKRSGTTWAVSCIPIRGRIWRNLATMWDRSILCPFPK